jgi:hypothetical protein
VSDGGGGTGFSLIEQDPLRGEELSPGEMRDGRGIAGLDVQLGAASPTRV